MSIKYGMNLSGGPITYDGSAIIFADLWFGTASGWEGYGGPFRPDGYPAGYDSSGSPSYTYIVALMGLNGRLPAGTYTLQVDGTGEIGLAGNGIDNQGNWINYDPPGGVDNTYTFTLPVETDGVSPMQLRLHSSDVSDPIRNIRVWLPGHVGHTFYQPFLDNCSHFSTFRFMDWLGTNGSTWVNWADRNSTGYSFSQRGYIDLTYAVQLCNATGKDMWLNLPGLMTDAGLASMASYVDTNLDSGLGLVVEFSNEVWNTALPQWAQFAARNGGNISWEYVADLDAHSTSYFKSHITSGRSCKVVIARQGEYDATLQVAQQRYALAGATYDLIALAPYFFSTADLQSNATLYQTDPTTAVTNILAGMPGTGSGDSAATVAKNLADVTRWLGYANTAGVGLAFYEWGQSLADPYSQNSGTIPLIRACNRDARMGALYTQFMTGLPDGIGPLNHFNDCGLTTQYGAWGALEYTAQAAQSPLPVKWAALIGAGSSQPPALAAGTLSPVSVTQTTATVSIATDVNGTAPYRNQLRVSAHGDGSWADSGTAVAGSTASLTASGLSASTQYDLRVVVTDSASGSATSNTITVTTSAIPATTPKHPPNPLLRRLRRRPA